MLCGDSDVLNINCLLQKILLGDAEDFSSLKSPDILCHKSGAEFVPVTKHTVCYVVSVVLFDENGRVLLIQEAKSSCRGKWYLPAGRVEPNETLKESAVRETLEEAGLRFEPTTLIALETQGTQYLRFTFTGKITGGQVKTKMDEDSESIQAQWFDVADVMGGKVDIRARDIKPLIKIGVAYVHALSTARHAPCLPADISHKLMTVQYLLIDLDSDQSCSVLVNHSGHPHFPVVQLGGSQTYASVIFQLLEAVYGTHSGVTVTPKGVARVEYKSGPQGDGVCLTLVYTINSTTLPCPQPYSWCTVTDQQLLRTLLTRIKLGHFVPLIR